MGSEITNRRGFSSKVLFPEMKPLSASSIKVNLQEKSTQSCFLCLAVSHSKKFLSALFPQESRHLTVPVYLSKFKKTTIKRMRILSNIASFLVFPPRTRKCITNSIWLKVRGKRKSSFADYFAKRNSIKRNFTS